jgi:hypothetical protein
MSQMAERLFPGEQRETPLELGVAHGAHTEIDLASLGGSTVVSDDLGYEDIGTGQTFTDGATKTPFHDRDDSIHGTRPRVDTKREFGPELPKRGEIDSKEHSVAFLLAALFNRGHTGRIGFQRDETHKVIYYESGRPVFATSSLPHDRMGDLLFREGKITRAQHRKSREVVADSGRRMGEILVEEGFLKPRELMPAVRRHVEDIFYSLFSWTRGQFEIHADQIGSAERIRLARHPAALVLEGVRRKCDLSVVEGLLGSREAVVELTHADRVHALASQIELLPAEERALKAVDGLRPLNEVARSAEADLLSVAQVLYSLIALGAARVVPDAAADAPLSEDTQELVGESDIEIDRQRVLAKFELVCEADYFQLLGVRRDATSFEIRRAYESAVRDYDRDAFAGPIRAELAQEIDEIQDVLKEAYDVLHNEGLRESYLHNLVT